MHSRPGTLDPARRILANANYLLILTGAGISAESGVPTFRGKDGYWRGHDPFDLATPEAFARDPRLVWDWYLVRRNTVAACEPNAAHRAIAAWLEKRDGVLITQNVDGLHERAGAKHVFRFHGSLWRNKCSSCNAERDCDDLAYDELPRSACCDAFERSGVVWFGEAIPRDAYDAAVEGLENADAMLVVGTSGVVFPAAGIVHAARARDIPVIEVNPDETNGPPGVMLIRASAAEAVPSLLRAS